MILPPHPLNNTTNPPNTPNTTTPRQVEADGEASAAVKAVKDRMAQLLALRSRQRAAAVAAAGGAAGGLVNGRVRGVAWCF